MKTTALITRRDSRIRKGNWNDLIRLGFKIETILEHGVIVKADKKKLFELESQGFRVKVIPDTNIISLGRYKFDLSKDELPELPRSMDLSKSKEKIWKQHIVQLAGPIQKEWLQKLRKIGIDIVDRISNYGLLLYGDRALIERAEKLPFITWAGFNKPAYRISQNLEGKRGRVKWVNISVYPASEKEGVIEKIKSYNGEIESIDEMSSMYGDDYAVILAELAASRVKRIAKLPDVKWVEFQGPEMPEDERSCQITAGNLDASNQPTLGYQNDVIDPINGLGLSGEGVTIGICDSGIDTNDNATKHQDLAGRMDFSIQGTDGFWRQNPNTGVWRRAFHGTHVACIALGNPAGENADNNGFLLGQGMAPHARFGNLPMGNDTTNAETIVENNGELSNNSWGGAAGAGYTNRSRRYDLLARNPDSDSLDLEKLTFVFSAGNSGSGASTITAPKEAKNIIVVGNANGVNAINNGSSRGPALDGRILPTIVAPGTNIPSARSSIELTDDFDPPRLDGGTERVGNPFSDAEPDYSRLNGTSMAAPHVSGLCALIIEWWRDRTGGHTPSPALLKAFLINGAVDIAGGTGVGGNIPNNNQGWGRVSLRNMVLQAPASDRGPRIFVDQRHAFTENGQFFRIRVAPADTARPMRITLVWTDAAGAANADPALVNDLDLEVSEENTGNLFKGNVFSDGFSETGEEADNLNNIECVYLQSPEGVYEINVLASNLQASAHPNIDDDWQDFALVIDNAEIPMADPVSVVPVIDRSGSMNFYGYVDFTLVSSQQFVDLMSVDDKLGIVSFGSTSKKEYPGNEVDDLQTITGTEIRNQANSAISDIHFSGCTYMGAGINQAKSMLESAGGSKAMVLLSDGFDNKGCSSDPARPSALDAVSDLPDDIPIYSCAMGPTSDQSLLEQLASVSQGRYYYMPTIDDLFEIYNYIRGQVSSDSIIVNESSMASSSRIGGFVDELAEEAIFTASWVDSSLRYVDREPLKPNEISVQLRSPNGKLIHHNDSYVRKIVGDGYIGFKINNPAPGQWYVEVKTIRNVHTKYTVGGFVKSPIKLELLKIPQRVIPGSPIKISVKVEENGKSFSGYNAEVTSICPDFNIAELLKRKSSILRKIKPDRKALQDGLPNDLAKLMQLRQILLEKEGNDIFAHKRCSKIKLQPRKSRFQFRGKEERPSIIPTTKKNLLLRNREIIKNIRERLDINPDILSGIQNANQNNTMNGSFSNTSNKGSYNMLINVSGVTPDSNVKFVRKEMVSVLVD